MTMCPPDVDNLQHTGLLTYVKTSVPLITRLTEVVQVVYRTGFFGTSVNFSPQSKSHLEEGVL